MARNMSQFDTSGSGDMPVGGADGAVRIHIDDIDQCNHRDNNVCPICAELTDEEVAAIRHYFALLAEKRQADE